MREATAMVEIVHFLLKNQLGRKYQRLPLEDRQDHFHQLDETLAEFARAQTADESFFEDRTPSSEFGVVGRVVPQAGAADGDFDDDSFEESIEAVFTLVAEWLLVERYSKRAAIRRLHAAGGTKGEAKAMVRLVNAVLRRGLGWRYQTLPEEERRSHFREVQHLFSEHVGIRTFVDGEEDPSEESRMS